MKVSEVRDGYGLEEDANVELFKSNVYGVKFDFMSGGPGYSGDLFILQDDTLETPLVLIRKHGTLKKHA